MRLFLLVLAWLFLESSATLLLKKAALLNLAGLGNPCKTDDEPCCKNKFSKLVPILITHIGSPLIVPKLKVGYGKGVLQLDQTLEHLKIEGLNKANVKDSKLNLAGGKLEISLAAKQLKLSTKYNINGRCLVLPIWGRGDGVFTLKDVDIKMDMAVGLDNANLCLHNVKMLIKVGGINYKFSSLFGEIKKKILTPVYEKFFNDNGLLVLNEVLPEYTAALEKHLSVILKPVLAYNLAGGKLEISLTAKQLKLSTKYNINGRCLVLPIWGRGDGVFTLKDVDIKMDMAVGLDNANLCLHNVKMLIKVGGINYKFSSLFGEIKKKILTPVYEKVFNDNGLLVLNEVLPEYTAALEKHLSVVLKPVLALVPLNAILLAPVHS